MHQGAVPASAVLVKCNRSSRSDVQPLMKIRCVVSAIVVAASAAVPVVVASPADALSCVGPSTVIADAPQVYAGRIVDARDNHVLVDVTEVWKGAPVEERVWLGVTMVEWTSWTTAMAPEIPDGYSSPDTWVFAPEGAGTVGPCNAWSMEDRGSRKYLLPHRPDEPQAPVADGTLQDAGEATPATGPARASLWPLVGGGAGLAVAVSLAALLLVRRRLAT